jgi:hypothetical protein
VSRAMREGGGMPTNSEWFPSSLSRPWNLVQDLKNHLRNHGYVRMIELDPRNPESSGQPVEASGSIAIPGDLVYYQWNGQDTITHVHMSMIAGFNGKRALVSKQSSGGHHAVNRPWDLSYITRGKRLIDIHPNMRVYILHWQ